MRFSSQKILLFIQKITTFLFISFPSFSCFRLKNNRFKIDETMQILLDFKFVGRQSYKKVTLKYDFEFSETAYNTIK